MITVISVVLLMKTFLQTNKRNFVGFLDVQDAFKKHPCLLTQNQTSAIVHRFKTGQETNYALHQYKLVAFGLPKNNLNMGNLSQN